MAPASEVNCTVWEAARVSAPFERGEGVGVEDRGPGVARGEGVDPSPCGVAGVVAGPSGDGDEDGSEDDVVGEGEGVGVVAVGDGVGFLSNFGV